MPGAAGLYRNTVTVDACNRAENSSQQLLDSSSSHNTACCGGRSNRSLLKFILANLADNAWLQCTGLEMQVSALPHACCCCSDGDDATLPPSMCICYTWIVPLCAMSTSVASHTFTAEKPWIICGDGWMGEAGCRVASRGPVGSLGKREQWPDTIVRQVGSVH